MTQPAHTLNQRSSLCKCQIAYSLVDKFVDSSSMAAKVLTYKWFISGAAASSQLLPSDAQALVFFANAPLYAHSCFVSWLQNPC
jgi:hypothetical protein